MPTTVTCTKCERDFDAAGAAAKRVSRTVKAGAQALSLPCPFCKQVVMVLVAGTEPEAPAVRCPVPRCGGFVSHVAAKGRSPEFWGCGECGSVWRDEEGLRREVTALLLDGIVSNPKFAGFEPRGARDLKKLSAAHPGLPADYLAFLRDVGFGQTSGPTYMIYGGPVAPSGIYDKQSARALEGLLVFGDDMLGYCNAFDPASDWRVVEIDLHTKKPRRVAATFVEFIRARLLKQPAKGGPRRKRRPTESRAPKRATAPNAGADDAELRDAVKQAVCEGVRDLRARHGGRAPKGICLCTDDNTCTIFAKATFGVPQEFEFASGEWEEELRDDLFRRATALVEARASSESDGPVEWRRRFQTFVDALQGARDAGGFGNEAELAEMVLMVVSTDPSREMAELGFESVRALSSLSIYRRLRSLVDRNRGRAGTRPKRKEPPKRGRAAKKKAAGRKRRSAR